MRPFRYFLRCVDKLRDIWILDAGHKMEGSGNHAAWVRLLLVYLNGKNAAERENHIEYGNCYHMNWTVKNCFAQDVMVSLW